MGLTGQLPLLGVDALRIADRVRVDQVENHYERTLVALCVGMVLCVGVAVALAPVIGLAAGYSWLAVKLLVSAYRLIEILRFKRDAHHAERIGNWEQRYWWWMCLDGVVWGAMALVFTPSGIQLLDMLIRTLICGVAAIGVFSVMGSKRLSIGFSLTTLLPVMASILLVENHLIGWTAVGCLLIYLGMLSFEAIRVEHAIQELLWLRHQTAWIAEQHRIAQARAEESSAAKSRFLATVSHELRTPLNGILGMAQLQARTPLEAMQRHRNEVIEQSARHLRTVIDDILDMARIESGRIELSSKPFDLRAVVEVVCEMLLPLAQAKGLRLTVRVGRELPARWLGDADRIRQVLHNLIGNAIKFTSQGKVGLSVERSDDLGLRFVVTDTGPGIPAASLERIFEPFEQVLRSGTGPDARGTGLGLAIARQLARAMGGDVHCRSSAMAGSTFVFDLACTALDDAPPQAEPAVPPAPTAPRAEPLAALSVPRGARVLLVEDNPVNAAVAEAALTLWGLHCVHVDCGEAALELQPGDGFDLVLMDIQLPGIDGCETARRWRANESQAGAARRARIIAVTASAAAEDRALCLAAGMDDYLSKPFELETFAAVLRRWLPVQPPGKG